MKATKIFSAALMSVLICIGAAVTANAECKNHTYNKNGFCTTEDCGAYQEAVPNDDGVYEISNAGQLYWFAGLVNGTLTDGTKQNKAANAILKDNIILNANLLKSLDVDTNKNVTNGTSFKAWTPIGNSALNRYTGTFNGNSKTISGLYFNDTTAKYVGLFGYIGYGVEVSDLGVIDTYINANEYVGGLCGYAYGNSSSSSVTIDNCYSEVTVNGTDYVGGLCGCIKSYASNSVTMNNCYSTGTVSGTETVGGLCGCAYGASSSNSVTIDSCYSTAEIKAVVGEDENPLYVGGFCGEVSATNSAYVIINNCYSTSDITFDSKEDVFSYIGGFCGRNRGTIKNSYSTGKITKSGVSSTNFVDDTDDALTNCYYLADDETETSDGITGKTDKQFASGEVAYLLNGSTSEGDSLAWGQTLTGEDADEYPVLGGSKVYQSTPCTLEYSNTEGVTKEHDYNSAYQCQCGYKLTKIVTSTNETEMESEVPQLTAGTVIFNKNGTVSDFKYDGTSPVTTVYVKIYNVKDGVTPAIHISGDAGTVENSQTWTLIGENIYYAQFIGDFSKFGEIKVTYDGADDVIVQSAATSEDK